MIKNPEVKNHKVTMAPASRKPDQERNREPRIKAVRPSLRKQPKWIRQEMED